MEVESFKSKLIHRAKTETTPIPTICRDEISRLRRHHEVVPDDLLKEIPSFAFLMSILYRQRHKTLPKLPATGPEIHLEGQWTLTEAGEHFLHRMDNDILIFTTSRNIEHLCAADEVFGDGTFSSAPRLFEQSMFQGHMFPLVYCRLPNKSEDTYTKTFEHLRLMAQQQNCYFNPRTFQLDFEITAHNAFPNTLLRGCYFHFTQCIWRRVQKEGLAMDYKNDDEVRRLVRRAAALLLFPLDKVDDIWLQAIADSPAGPKVAAFMDYVRTTWVEGHQFGPEIWNYFGNQGHRTNNDVEGWNHKLNKLARKSHPNIFVQREQSNIGVAIQRIGAHWSAPPRKRRYRLIDNRLQALKDNLVNNVIGEVEYTDHVGDLIHLE